MKPRFKMVPVANPDVWKRAINLPGLLENIYTALTGRLCLVAEQGGAHFAVVSDIKVEIPLCVRQTSEIACATLTNNYELSESP